MMEENTNNPISAINEESIKNFNAQELKARDYTFFGEYEYIRIPSDKRNLRDVNFCSDKYIGFLRNEVLQDTINILKEF